MTELFHVTSGAHSGETRPMRALSGGLLTTSHNPEKLQELLDRHPFVVNSIESYSLRKCGMKCVPHALLSFGGLKSLDLSANSLTHIPGEFIVSCCPALEKLDLASNQLCEMLELSALAPLAGLRDLDLRGNMHLPYAHQRIYRLTTLLLPHTIYFSRPQKLQLVRMGVPPADEAEMAVLRPEEDDTPFGGARFDCSATPTPRRAGPFRALQLVDAATITVDELFQVTDVAVEAL